MAQVLGLDAWDGDLFMNQHARSLNDRLDETYLMELYEGGFSIRAIADQVGCSFSTIRNILLRERAEMRRDKGSMGVHPNQLRQWIYLLGRGEDERVLEEMGGLLEKWENKHHDSQERAKDE